MKLKTSQLFNLTKDTNGRQQGFRLLAKGNSMFPALKNGDILTIKPIELNKLKPLDIVCCKFADERIVIHRIIKLLDSSLPQYLIKGDYTFGKAEKVYGSDILGKLCLIERKGKITDLNRFYPKVLDHLLAKSAPLLRVLRLKAGLSLRVIQGLSFYSKLLKLSFKPNIIYRKISLDGGLRIEALSKEKIVASADINYFEPEEFSPQGYWISGMWVKWPYRRLGIASKLTAELCAFALSKNTNKVFLWVFNDNLSAMHLYRKLGFYLFDNLKKEQFKRQRIIMCCDLAN